MTQLNDAQRARLRERSKMRDGDGSHLRPVPGRFWTVTYLANSGLCLAYVRIRHGATTNR